LIDRQASRSLTCSSYPPNMPSSSKLVAPAAAVWCWMGLLLAASWMTTPVAADCLSNPDLDAEFLSFIEGAESIPLEGSCCQADVCGIPCPEVVEDPGVGTFVQGVVPLCLVLFLVLSLYKAL
jgi:hypothetical protein